jgi:VCBS repeat-containing protein
MSYLHFDDQATGVHVFFDEARDATFKESDIATLTQGSSHTVAFSIDFTAASGKQVTITIDGMVKAVGSTWASYYQTVEHNPASPVKTMLFRAGGTAARSLAGQGYLIDILTYASS